MFADFFNSTINKPNRPDLIAEVIKNYQKHMIKKDQDREEIFLNESAPSKLTSKQVVVKIERK
jgi:hypothetical protein